MTLQDVLFIAGIALLVIGVILAGIAVYLFITRNVPDIIADLNGTKRAEALEAMARENMRRSRRRGKSGETTGSLGSNTGNVATQPASPQPGASQTTSEAPAQETTMVDDSAPTAVMRDDSAATTVLDPGAADATTLLEATEPQLAEPQEEPQLKQVVEEERIPDNFEIVRKIVLTDSTEFIRPEQGEQYA